jgi:hypothetical protein
VPIEPTLISIQVGMPQTVSWGDFGESKQRTWETGFLKESVTDSVWLGATKLDGDGPADSEHHGGVDKAVCVYSLDPYHPYGWSSGSIHCGPSPRRIESCTRTKAISLLLRIWPRLTNFLPVGKRCSKKEFRKRADGGSRPARCLFCGSGVPTSDPQRSALRY